MGLAEGQESGASASSGPEITPKRRINVCLCLKAQPSVLLNLPSRYHFLVAKSDTKTGQAAPSGALGTRLGAKLHCHACSSHV